MTNAQGASSSTSPIGHREFVIHWALGIGHWSLNSLHSPARFSHPFAVALPLTYNVRNVFVRWRATLATVLGIALVVAVYMLVQSLAIGLEKSSRNTGDPRNVLIVRKGSTAESSSIITREQFKLLQYLPQIGCDTNGQPLISADTLV